jgi:hypothetical protein
VDASWWVLGGIVLAAVIGGLVYFRSIHRWKDTEPTSAEAKRAEASLWSAKNMGQR